MKEIVKGDDLSFSPVKPSRSDGPGGKIDEYSMKSTWSKWDNFSDCSTVFNAESTSPVKLVPEKK